MKRISFWFWRLRCWYLMEASPAAWDFRFDMLKLQSHYWQVHYSAAAGRRIVAIITAERAARRELERAAAAKCPYIPPPECFV